MTKTQTRGHEKTKVREQHEEHCILCEAIIEIGDHEVYFATGRCRYCDEVLKEE